MLELNYQTALLEAGLDEAGRGCYAGPVFAAAVILPTNFYHPLLNDSKKLTPYKRDVIYQNLISRSDIVYSVGIVDEKMIDKIRSLISGRCATQRPKPPPLKRAALSRRPGHTTKTT